MKPNKYNPDPPGYSRERETASEKHRKLNEAAGPGRWRTRTPYWREVAAQQSRMSFRQVARHLIAKAGRS